MAGKHVHCLPQEPSLWAEMETVKVEAELYFVCKRGVWYVSPEKKKDLSFGSQMLREIEHKRSRKQLQHVHAR